MRLGLIILSSQHPDSTKRRELNVDIVLEALRLRLAKAEQHPELWIVAEEGVTEILTDLRQHYEALPSQAGFVEQATKSLSHTDEILIMGAPMIPLYRGRRRVRRIWSLAIRRPDARPRRWFGLGTLFGMK